MVTVYRFRSGTGTYAARTDQSSRLANFKTVRDQRRLASILLPPGAYGETSFEASGTEEAQ